MMTKATKSDYFPEELFPNGVSFTYPDHMVRLNEYASRLVIENVQQGVATGERIPASAVTMRLASEFGLTTEQVAQYRLIGNYVAYDRELRDLSPEELRQDEIDKTPSEEQIAEFEREFGDKTPDFVDEALYEKYCYEKIDRLIEHLFGEEG